ncbi:MAG: flagellar basal body P-ring formation protein FlgA [Gammaproteobacteria bacterium]|nr:flagellar basal body P-ring formation protein FlgA [Gammaproteobacteria bacterium]
MIEMLVRNVRNLTIGRRCRQRFVARQTELRVVARRTVATLALSTLVFTASAVADTGAAWHPIAEIRLAAELFLLEKTGGRKERTSVRAGSLDPRHRLAQCSEPLAAFLRRGAKIAARTIVGVRCSGSKPWKVYLPVDLVVSAQVATSARNLPRGHTVTADDLAVDERDVSRFIAGYFTDPTALVGQTLKQAIVAGRVVTPSMLKVQHVVERGQTVTLTSAGSGIAISMLGKALMNGTINQRIRVENVNSGRIVEGVVRSGEQVEILPPAASNFFHAKPKVSP